MSWLQIDPMVIITPITLTVQIVSTVSWIVYRQFLRLKIEQYTKQFLLLTTLWIVTWIVRIKIVLWTVHRHGVWHLEEFWFVCWDNYLLMNESHINLCIAYKRIITCIFHSSIIKRITSHCIDNLLKLTMSNKYLQPISLGRNLLNEWCIILFV